MESKDKHCYSLASSVRKNNSLLSCIYYLFVICNIVKLYEIFTKILRSPTVLNNKISEMSMALSVQQYFSFSFDIRKINGLPFDICKNFFFYKKKAYMSRFFFTHELQLCTYKKKSSHSEQDIKYSESVCLSLSLHTCICARSIEPRFQERVQDARKPSLMPR